LGKNHLTHIDKNGHAAMVEVTQKTDTKREAVAQGFIQLSKKVVTLIRENNIAKGNPLEVARIAGIMGAKKTAELIPLCHQLLLTKVEVDLNLTSTGVEIKGKVVSVGKTGVEMEALTAVSVAALTIYDMCKAVDKEMTIGDIYLVKKSGGRSGTFIKSSRAAKRPTD